MKTEKTQRGIAQPAAPPQGQRLHLLLPQLLSLQRRYACLLFFRSDGNGISTSLTSVPSSQTTVSPAQGRRDAAAGQGAGKRVRRCGNLWNGCPGLRSRAPWAARVPTIKPRNNDKCPLRTSGPAPRQGSLSLGRKLGHEAKDRRPEIVAGQRAAGRRASGFRMRRQRANTDAVEVSFHTAGWDERVRQAGEGGETGVCACACGRDGGSVQLFGSERRRVLDRRRRGPLLSADWLRPSLPLPFSATRGSHPSPPWPLPLLATYPGA